MSTSTIGNKGYITLMDFGSFSAKPLYWDEVDSTDLNHIPNKEMVDKYLAKVEVVDDYLDDKIFRNNPDLGNGATEDNYILHDMDKYTYYFVDTQGYDYPRYVTKLIGFTEKMKKGGVVDLKWVKRGDNHFANGKNKYTIEKIGSSYTLYVGDKAVSKGGLRVMKGVAQEKEKNISYLEGMNKMEDGGGVNDVVYFAVDDEKLDGKLHTKYDNDLDYLEVGSDVYYVLPQRQFDRFMDDAFSMGLDESIEKVDKNGRTLDEYGDGGETEDLEDGDRVKVVYGNEFYGETGTISEIKRGFVIVEMDRDGKEYSMHISDVQKIDDEEDDDYDDDDYAKGGFVNIVPQGANWFNGSYGDYKFDAKLFSGETHNGINGGSVIKLLIRKGDKVVANYDRGWDIKPTRDNMSAYMSILKALTDKKYEMGGKTPEMPNGGQILTKTHKLHK